MSAFSNPSDLAPIKIWDGVVARAVAGAEATFALIELEPNTHVPEHHHVNEQTGILLRGSMSFTIGDETKQLQPGEMWVIPADVPHSVISGPQGVTLAELFAPPRADWVGLERLPATPVTLPYEQVPSTRRLSQRISEGDGISIIVCVDDAGAAQAAEAQGAEAVAVTAEIDGIRSATSLPVLWLGTGAPSDVDAVCIRPDDDSEHDHLEAVVDVRDEEELELALERLDPEVFLLNAHDIDEDVDPLDAVLELLPDVPAGKLAIAQVEVASRDEVLALERAGVDAVLVRSQRIDELVGDQPVSV
jgi:quercetin dioxygenase-like cupin family protein